jgi:phage protein D
MPSKPANPTRVPALRLRINGADVSEEIAADLVSATIHDDLDAPGMFTLRLINWDMNKLAVTWADDQRFAEGGKIEVQMGYVDHVKTILAGEITGLEPEFAADEVPMLTVRGYDRRHRLMRGQRTRTFTKMKDSDIARQVITDAGLSVQATDSGSPVNYVLQHNQSDMEFLQQRASMIGYELAIDGEKILFRPRQNAKSATLTLDRTDDLIEFMPRLSTLAQTGNVVVRGWDVQQKEAVMAKASAGSETTTMGGRTSGPRATSTAFGTASATTIIQPTLTKADADRLAKSQFNTMALAYINGEGLSIGRTDLRAGMVVAINGVGKRFSGAYYIISTRHIFSPDRGYRTAFTFRRNAT